MALKSVQVVDFLDKWRSKLADFENTVDRGSAVNFVFRIVPTCLSVRTLGPKRNLDHRSFFSCVKELIHIFFFFSDQAHLNSGERLLLELYCVILIRHVAFCTI